MFIITVYRKLQEIFSCKLVQIIDVSLLNKLDFISAAIKYSTPWKTFQENHFIELNNLINVS